MRAHPEQREQRNPPGLARSMEALRPARAVLGDFLQHARLAASGRSPARRLTAGAAGTLWREPGKRKTVGPANSHVRVC